MHALREDVKLYVHIYTHICNYDTTLYYDNIIMHYVSQLYIIVCNIYNYMWYNYIIYELYILQYIQIV